MVQRIFIFFVIGLVAGLIGFYLIVNTSPFDTDTLQSIIEEEQIEDGDIETLIAVLEREVQDGLLFDYLSPSAYVVFSLILLSIFSFFISIHLAVDKLFFKKFFEPPSMFDAIRRGAFILLTLTGVVLLGIYDAVWWMYVAALAVIVLVEVFVVLYVRMHVYERLKAFREKNV